MEGNIIQFKGGTMINADVSVKNVMFVIMFEILLHVNVQIENI